ncbi:transposase [Burkholderia lata]|nr:transposase [Burkholderia lata]
MILVYRYRVKSLNGLLNKQSRAVNYVWNFCSDTPLNLTWTPIWYLTRIGKRFPTIRGSAAERQWSNPFAAIRTFPISARGRARPFSATIRRYRTKTLPFE